MILLLSVDNCSRKKRVNLQRSEAARFLEVTGFPHKLLCDTVPLIVLRTGELPLLLTERIRPWYSQFCFEILDPKRYSFLCFAQRFTCCNLYFLDSNFVSMHAKQYSGRISSWLQSVIEVLSAVAVLAQPTTAASAFISKCQAYIVTRHTPIQPCAPCTLPDKTI